MTTLFDVHKYSVEVIDMLSDPTHFDVGFFFDPFECQLVKILHDYKRYCCLPICIRFHDLDFESRS